MIDNESDLYDDSAVSPAVKRLASCFNIVAMDPENRDASEDALMLMSMDMFSVVQRGPVAIASNADEAFYMYKEFLKVSTAKRVDQQNAKEESRLEAGRLYAAALKAKLIQ